MNVKDIYSAKAIASVYNEVASNKIAPLGAGLFPSKKKMGLDLKSIRTSKGLPVALQASAFDTVSTIRSREGIKLMETEMAFFKESMLLKEQDEQDIMRIQESADPYAAEVIDRIFDDANTLIEGADVIPEIMRMQLLSNENGHPSISISSDGATYEYNYDPDNDFHDNNYVELTSTDVWTDLDDSDPMKDIADAQDAVEAKSGTRPSILLISKATMNLLKQNQKVRNYILAQNTSATVIVTDARVKEVFASELGVNIIVYTKQYKGYDGQAHKFYPDGVATLLPEGALGSTYYGTTPEERTGMQNPAADVSIVNTGVAVSVTISEDPVQTKTTVSEIVLPSFERMNECYIIKAYTPS